MNPNFSTLIFLFFSTHLLAQSNISLEQSAPKINVTDWVLNAPADKSLEGKFIILEFWATWCGPCIAAVPHMNEIQSKFNRKDLYFISITDESVEKIKRTLERVPFKSIVVSDQTKKTHINYGDGKEKLEAYPMTVLIDKSNKIKWIGEPKQLTENIVNDFLSGKLKGFNHFTESKTIEIETFISEEKPDKNVVESQKTTPTPPSQNSVNSFFDLVKNKDVKYHFEIKVARNENMIKSLMGGKAAIISQFNLKDIFADLLKVNIDSVDSTNGLDTLKYVVAYKNDKPNSDALARLELDILNSLDLRKKTEKKSVAKNHITIADNSKLKPALEKIFSSMSDADDKILFNGFTINQLIDNLNKIVKTKFAFSPDNRDKYDFIIETKSLQKIEESLKSYGLNWTAKMSEVDFVTLELKK